MTIAVNVSTVQIHAASFPKALQDILFETRLAPGRLELEITETALIRDPGRALATLSRIKTMGVHVVMDDFGTGYSSLANLRAFPFDKIKIDGSFIKAVQRQRRSGDNRARRARARSRAWPAGARRGRRDARRTGVPQEGVLRRSAGLFPRGASRYRELPPDDPRRRANRCRT